MVDVWMLKPNSCCISGLFSWGGWGERGGKMSVCWDAIIFPFWVLLCAFSSSVLMEGWPQQLSGDYTICRVPYIGSSEWLNRMGAGDEREKKPLRLFWFISNYSLSRALKGQFGLVGALLDECDLGAGRQHFGSFTPVRLITQRGLPRTVGSRSRNKPWTHFCSPVTAQWDYSRNLNVGGINLKCRWCILLNTILAICSAQNSICPEFK